jgi:hypothetical protein
VDWAELKADWRNGVRGLTAENQNDRNTQRDEQGPSHFFLPMPHSGRTNKALSDGGKHSHGS